LAKKHRLPKNIDYILNIYDVSLSNVQLRGHPSKTSGRRGVCVCQ